MDPNSFRPVALLCGIGELQERIVFKYIHTFLNENDLIYKYQSGFLPNHSTSFKLIDIFHHTLLLTTTSLLAWSSVMCLKHLTGCGIRELFLNLNN